VSARSTPPRADNISGLSLRVRADFCLWAPREPGSVVGDVEGSMVAWCTKEGRGTRIIPAGALTGGQSMVAGEPQAAPKAPRAPAR